MALIADCHLHSSFSGDSDTPMEAMVEKALELGLKEICFTEHNDFDFVYTEDEKEGYWEVNADAYLYDLLRFRSKYEGKLKIYYGLELGMQTICSRKNLLFCKDHEFDFVIASSHLCNGKDPYLKETFFGGRSEEEAVHEYFSYMAECIKGFQNFDVYGHLDYVLRYTLSKGTAFTFEEYREDIDRVLKLLIDNGKGIEANTSGYAYGMGGPHPRMEILKRYRELGGERITVGSDAHKPEYIATNYALAAQTLTDCGFRYYCVYEKRVPHFIKL